MALPPFIVLCELSFLKELVKKSPGDFDDFRIAYDQLLEFLRKRACLVVNRTREELESLRREAEPIVDVLLARAGRSDLLTQFVPHNEWQAKVKAVCSGDDQRSEIVVLRSGEGDLSRLRSLTGRLFASNGDVLQTWSRIGLPHIWEVSKSRAGTEWKRELRQMCLPVRSMIIVDRFVREKRCAISESLRELLEVMLPNGPVPYVVDILIVSEAKIGEPESVDVNAARINLSEAITNIRPALDVNIKVVLVTRDEYHDRHVFTPYALLKSGRSLKDLPKKTTLDYHPLFDEECHQVGNSFLGDVSYMVRNAPREFLGRRLVAGNCGHPILKAYDGTDKA